MFCIYSRYTHAQTDEPIVIHSACYIAKLNTNIYYICMHTSNISHMMHALPYLSLSCHCSPPPPPLPPTRTKYMGRGRTGTDIPYSAVFVPTPRHLFLSANCVKGGYPPPLPPPSLCDHNLHFL